MPRKAMKEGIEAVDLVKVRKRKRRVLNNVIWVLVVLFLGGIATLTAYTVILRTEQSTVEIRNKANYYDVNKAFHHHHQRRSTNNFSPNLKETFENALKEMWQKRKPVKISKLIAVSGKAVFGIFKYQYNLSNFEVSMSTLPNIEILSLEPKISDSCNLDLKIDFSLDEKCHKRACQSLCQYSALHLVLLFCQDGEKRLFSF